MQNEHCARTNPELWEKFSKWFKGNHGHNPYPLSWTEEAVSAHKDKFLIIET